MCVDALGIENDNLKSACLKPVKDRDISGDALETNHKQHEQHNDVQKLGEVVNMCGNALCGVHVLSADRVMGIYKAYTSPSFFTLINTDRPSFPPKAIDP